MLSPVWGGGLKVAAGVQVWRKSKRVAEDASAGKGIAPAAGAYAKRNRSALDDITNSYMLIPEQPERMVTRSSLRAAQTQVFCMHAFSCLCCLRLACARPRLAADADVVFFLIQQACHGVLMGAAQEASSSQRWAAPREVSNAMVLSPAGGSAVGMSERLLDRLGAFFLTTPYHPIEVLAGLVRSCCV